MPEWEVIDASTLKLVSALLGWRGLARRGFCLVGVGVSSGLCVGLLACGATREAGHERSENPPPAAAKGSQRRLLRPQLEVGAALAGGEDHAYALELSPGQFAAVVLEQQGIDVVLDLYAPDGQRLTTVDSPNGEWGPETLSLVADAAPRDPDPQASAAYGLVVRSLNRQVPSGHYRLQIKTLRPATAEDRRRVEAERWFAAAEELRRQGKRPSFEAAIPKYRAAIAAWRDLGEPLAEAGALATLGGVAWLLDDLLAAQHAYGQALTLYEQLDQPGALAPQATTAAATEAAKMLNNLGELQLTLGKPEVAIGLLERGLARHRAVGYRAGELVALQNLGQAYLRVGHSEIALGLFEEARAGFHALQDHFHEGTAWSNIGWVYARLGGIQHAIGAFEQALALVGDAGNQREQARVLGALGWCHLLAGRFAQSLDYLERALKAQRQLGDHRQEAVTLNHMGTVHLQSGRLAEARRTFAAAHDRFVAIGDRNGTAVAATNLGWVEAALDPQRAAQLFADAAARFTALYDRHGEADARRGLAALAEQRGDLVAAAREMAVVLERVESLRGEPASADLRASFLASRQDYFSYQVQLLLALHGRNPAAGYAAQALAVAERARARTLLDQLARADLPRPADPTLLAQEAELERQIEHSETARQQLLTAAGSTDAVSALTLAVQQQLAALDRVRARIGPRNRKTVAANRAWHPQTLPFNLAQLQQQLDAHTLLLEYALREKQSYLFAVTSDGLQTFALPAKRALEQNARQAHRLLALSRKTLSRSELELTLQELSGQLLAPVADLLGQKHLLIVPDGALHYLPFGVLPLPATDRGEGSGASQPPRTALPKELLASRHQITVLPSASSLALLRLRRTQRAPPSATLAVLADPVFSVSDPRVRRSIDLASVASPGLPAATSREPAAPANPAAASVQAGAASADPAQAPGLPQDTRFRRLLYAGKEAADILAQVPSAQGFLATGFAANRQTVLTGKLERYQIVHFATHGVFDAAMPELSGIVLSQVDAEGRPQNGLIYPHDIARLTLTADLVVLSACRTALGEEVRGEGLVGLTRSFLDAGAQSVLVSLWEVDDQATAELMRHFYRGLLREGRSPAAALQAAQLAVAATAGWDAPYFWAGFILQGDGLQALSASPAPKHLSFGRSPH